MKQYKSPSGSKIIGTIERVPGCALINGIDDEGAPEYAGETEMFWDDQYTLRKSGKILFMDENGAEWTFEQLIALDESLYL